MDTQPRLDPALDPARVPIVLAERLDAIGWRLAGARVRVPEDADAALQDACADAALVIVTGPCARRMDATRLAAARRGLRPLVVVIGDAPGAEVERAARRALGVLP